MAEKQQQFRQASIEDPKNYLRLEGREHGSYSYGDLFVSTHRLQYGPLVEQAAKSLGLRVQNTAQEKDGWEYIGQIKHKNALMLNLTLDGRTLNPRQWIDFLLDLRDGALGKKIIYHGSGDKAEDKLLEEIYQEIACVRDPWRGEQLDANFSFFDGARNINYDHKIQNRVLVPQRIEQLEPYLERNGDKVVLKDFNRQGLAIKEDNNGEIYFWAPFDGSVAGFIAYSDRAGLGCDWGPADSGPQLGVRRVRENFDFSNLDVLSNSASSENLESSRRKK